MADDPALKMAVQWICSYEGFESAPYQDASPRKVWTIGYGSTYLADGSPVTSDTPAMTQEEAMALMAPIVAKTLGAVRGMVHSTITNNQAAALTSFAYNEGTQRLRSSSLMVAVNQGKMQEAADYFLQYVYAGGKVLPGLVQRRKHERQWFLTPDLTPDASKDFPRLAPQPVPLAQPEPTADELMARYNPSLHLEQ